MTGELDSLRGRVRELNRGFRAGDHNSAGAFKELVALMWGVTVGDGTVSPRLTKQYGSRSRWVLGGMQGPQDPLPMRNGHYLRLAVNLRLDGTDDGPRLQVRDSSYQYQLDFKGKDWVFRYDYEREPTDEHPPAHLHVRANPVAPIQTPRPFERLHFPAMRTSFESIMRLLIVQFGVQPAQPPDTWRAVLAESELFFNKIAHTPLSGPPASN